MQSRHSQILLAILVASPLAAAVAQQSTTADDAPRFATGITAGALHTSTQSEQAVTTVLQLQPTSWLTLAVSPGVGRMTAGGRSTSGLTDVPLSAGATYELDEFPWSPSLAAGLVSTLAVADSASGLGVDRTTVGGSLAVGAQPVEGLFVSVSGSHPFTAGTGNGSVELEASQALGPLSASLGISSEIGAADSGAVLARSLAAGLGFSVAGPLTLTIDGSRGLTSAAPSWTVSIGFGTAFAGISPVSATSPLRRLSKMFGQKVTATSGFSKSGTSGCKRAGTC